MGHVVLEPPLKVLHPTPNTFRRVNKPRTAAWLDPPLWGKIYDTRLWCLRLFQIPHLRTPAGGSLNARGGTHVL